VLSDFCFSPAPWSTRAARADPVRHVVLFFLVLVYSEVPWASAALGWRDAA
jgi:hypothetical protein